MAMNDVEEVTFRGSLDRLFSQVIRVRAAAKLIEAESLLVGDEGYTVADALDNMVGILERLTFDQYHEPVTRQGCGNPDCCDEEY